MKNLKETIRQTVIAAERVAENIDNNTTYLEWYDTENRIYNAPVPENVENLWRVQRCIRFLNDIISKMQYGQETGIFHELWKENKGSEICWNVRSICSRSLRKNLYDQTLTRNLNKALAELIKIQKELKL